MKSRTKNYLSEEKIKELLKVNFGEACEASEIIELTGGMFNAVYQIDRKTEQDQIILKIGPAPGTPLLRYEKDLMKREVQGMKLIEKCTTVPIPKVLACDFSKKYISGDYFFMTKVEGCVFSSVSGKMEKEQKEQILEEMAEYLAQIHRIKGSYFGYPTEEKNGQFRTWKEAFLSMFEILLKDAKERGYRLPYERIERILREYAPYLEKITVPVFVEYDCHEGNIFVKETNGEWHIEGIIDFERIFWGDPVADFAGAFFLISDIRKKPVFLSSYLKYSEDLKEYTEEDVVRYHLYHMYILTIMASEVFRYGRIYAWIQQTMGKRYLKKCMDELEMMGKRDR